MKSEKPLDRYAVELKNNPGTFATKELGFVVCAVTEGRIFIEPALHSTRDSQEQYHVRYELLRD